MDWGEYRLGRRKLYSFVWVLVIHGMVVFLRRRI